MKLLALALLSLLSSVLLTRLLAQDPGYVMVSYSGWTLENSLAVAQMLLLVYILMFVLLRLLHQVWTAPGRLRDWEQRRHQWRSRRSLIQSLVELAEGNWAICWNRWARRNMPWTVTVKVCL